MTPSVQHVRIEAGAGVELTRVGGVVLAHTPDGGACVMADTSEGIRLVLHPGVEARIDFDGEIESIRAVGATDELITGPVAGIRVAGITVAGITAAGDALRPISSPAADGFTTVSLVSDAIDTKDSADTDKAPLPIEEFELSGERVPGPVIVTGVLCEHGHFNREIVLYCAVCGVSMVHLTPRPVQGPRPSLGVLVADDGVTYRLVADMVIGRDPSADPAVRAGVALALVLDDPTRSVSRVHAEIRLSDWDVTVVDRGGAGGTLVCRPGDSSWTRLDPNEPVVIAPGTHVLVGRRSLLLAAPY